MTITAVLFDLDNTLVDFMSMKRKASKAAAEAMVKAGLKAGKRQLSKKLFDFYLEYGIESNDAFEKFLQKELGVVDYRILAHAVNAYVRTRDMNIKTYPGVKGTLTKLRNKGLKLGLISDGPRQKVWNRLVAAGLDEKFDIVVTYDDTGKRKPHRAPFLTACQQLKVKPNECLMVGDWPERDIEGAKVLGMKTCLAKYGKQTQKKIRSDYEIKGFSGLLGVIK